MGQAPFDAIRKQGENAGRRCTPGVVERNCLLGVVGRQPAARDLNTPIADIMMTMWSP